ncbi:MAG: helix-turn-helix domain-containing protein [Asticcacaulis sp.]
MPQTSSTRRDLISHEALTAPAVASVGDAARAGYVIDLVSLITGVPVADIRATDRRDARTSRARQLAMYLTYVAWQWPLYRIGAVFGRDRTTVGYACRRIEDLRDNRDVDTTLDWLEACLQALPETLSLRAVRNRWSRVY